MDFNFFGKTSQTFFAKCAKLSEVLKRSERQKKTVESFFLLYLFFVGRNDSDHEELVDQALNICLHLKNSLKNYSELITDCINKIVKLK